MERTIATAFINGKSYKLVPKTLKVQGEINALASLSNKVERGEADYTQLLSSQLAFIKSVADCHIFDNIPMEEIDIDDVTIACIEIMNGYNGKVKKAKTTSLINSIGTFVPKAGKKSKKGKEK